MENHIVFCIPNIRHHDEQYRTLTQSGVFINFIEKQMVEHANIQIRHDEASEARVSNY